MKRSIIISFVLLLLFSGSAAAQDYNISGLLTEIEQGNAEEVRIKADDLLKKNPGDPSIKYLDAVLTEDGMTAIFKLKSMVSVHPDSKYADAALYRIWSYYYAIGSYNTADDYYQQLKSDHPGSSYLDKVNLEKDSGLTDAKQTEEQKQVNEVTDDDKEEGSFYVQLGAFHELSNATSLKNELEDAGFNAELGEKDVGGTMLHVVYVGGFSSREKAEGSIGKLYDLTGLNGYVTVKGQ